ncbi:hypothetical protein KIN20_036611 [Parelaphostrongylus tenuis]|uniref:Uncharacterized protein n=1 Tax=Parelaphostrongylus tenuis TaxID=148309 RepID=A0AAD5RCS9_PARTN|nr:hypothetical protein KIN20_036611 [Parelaphostrongylus tenuis]
MRSTRGYEPDSRRTCSVRPATAQRYRREKNGRRRKRQPFVSKCAQPADRTRLSSDVWRPSDNGTAEYTVKSGRKTEGVENGNGM